MDDAPRSKCSGRGRRVLVALALAVLPVTSSGCAVALAGRPEPYAGDLETGQLVRAILEPGLPGYGLIHAVVRTDPGRMEVSAVSFPRAPRWQPADDGTMVVFRVIALNTFHTPPDALGRHRWLIEYEAEIIATELDEAEAITKALRCLDTVAGAAAYDREDPFAFGPGAAGGWSVRFSASDGAGALPPVIAHLDARGRCQLPLAAQANQPSP